jgi:hypothetical protein
MCSRHSSGPLVRAIRQRGVAPRGRRAAIRSRWPVLVWRTGSPVQRHSPARAGAPADWRSRCLGQWSSGSRSWPALRHSAQWPRPDDRPAASVLLTGAAARSASTALAAYQLRRRRSPAPPPASARCWASLGLVAKALGLARVRLATSGIGPRRRTAAPRRPGNEHACSQTLRRQAQYRANPPLGISVNLSARQFQNPHLIDDIQRTLTGSGLSPNCLKLENRGTL